MRVNHRESPKRGLHCQPVCMLSAITCIRDKFLLLSNLKPFYGDFFIHVCFVWLSFYFFVVVVLQVSLLSNQLHASQFPKEF